MNGSAEPIRILRIIARLNVGGPAKHVAWLMTGLDRRSAPSRARAVLERGLNASRRLLWPALGDTQRLLRAGRLRALT